MPPFRTQAGLLARQRQPAACLALHPPRHPARADRVALRGPARRPMRRPSLEVQAAPGPDRASDVEGAPLLDATPSARPSPVDWAAISRAFAGPALAGLLFGYDIGATSGALVSLKGAASGVEWASHLTALQSGAVVSASLTGALAGSAAAFVVGDRLGRKGELVLAGGLYAASAAAMSVVPTLPALLAARGVYGLGIGFAMHAAPAYIAETSPPAVRGLLVSLKEFFIVGGILAGYVASYAWVDAAGGWRLIYGAAALPAAALALGAAAGLPESPRWLALAGKGRAATRAALAACRGTGASPAELDAETDAIFRTAGGGPDGAAAGPPPSVQQMAADPTTRKALGIGLFLMLMQQVTGQPSVLYYAADIFDAAGFSAGSGAAGVAVGLGLWKLVMTGVAVATVERAGRRPLLLAGVGGMTVALACLAVASATLGGTPAGAWACVAALLLYVGCYQLGPGPVDWLLVAEIFPLAARGRAAALATLTNFGANAGVSLVLPTLQDAVGPAATYALFAGVAAVCWGGVWAWVPETKGKTLEDIEAMLGGKGQE